MRIRPIVHYNQKIRRLPLHLYLYLKFERVGSMRVEKKKLVMGHRWVSRNLVFGSSLLTLGNSEQKNGILIKLFCFSSDFDETW